MLKLSIYFIEPLSLKEQTQLTMTIKNQRKEGERRKTRFQIIKKLTELVYKIVTQKCKSCFLFAYFLKQKVDKK